MDLKVCSRCKLELPYDQFNKDPRYSLGLSSVCRSCARIRSKESRARSALRSKIIPTKKTCSKCNQVLSCSDFYKVSYARDGLARNCKNCSRKTFRTSKTHKIKQSKVKKEKQTKKIPKISLERILATGPFDVTILSGPSGSGKSFIAERLTEAYNVIDYDRIPANKLFNALVSDKKNLIVTPIRARFMYESLISAGHTARVIYLREPEDIIRTRLAMRNGVFNTTIQRRIARYERLLKEGLFDFYGPQNLVLDYLLKTSNLKNS
jgi:cytidylate kinase